LDNASPEQIRLYRDLAIYDQSKILETEIGQKSGENGQIADGNEGFTARSMAPDNIGNIEGVESQNLIKLYRAVGDYVELKNSLESSENGLNTGDEELAQKMEYLCYSALKYWKIEQFSP
jgi:hypothetical protein